MEKYFEAKRKEARGVQYSLESQIRRLEERLDFLRKVLAVAKEAADRYEALGDALGDKEFPII